MIILLNAANVLLMISKRAPCLHPLISSVTLPWLPAGRSSGAAAAARGEAHTSNAPAQVRERHLRINREMEDITRV